MPGRELRRAISPSSGPAEENGNGLPPQVSSFLKGYTRFLRTRAEYVIVLLLVVTAMFTPVLQRTRFETDLERFLPGDPVVEADRRVEGYFGSPSEPAYFLVRGENVLSAKALREELNITLQAAYIDGVAETYSLAGMVDELSWWRNVNGTWVRDSSRGLLNLSDRDVEGLRDLLLQLLDPALNLSGGLLPLPPPLDPVDLRLMLSSLLPGDFRYGERSARVTVVVAGINGSLPSEAKKDVAELLGQRMGALRLKQVSLSVTSASLIAREVDRATLEDNLPIAAGIFIVVMAMMGLSFRGLSYVLLPASCIAMSAVWTFGTARLLGIQLIAIDIAVVPLMIGLGVDYFIHVSSRYQEELKGEPRPGRAMSKALVNLFPSMSLAVLTTIAAFLTNIFTGIQPIREFGLLCALGVGSCALLSATFYPAARILLDRRKADARVATLRDVPFFSRGMAFGAQTVRRYPVLVVMAVVAVSAGAFIGALDLRTEFGVEDFVQEDWPSMRTIAAIREDFPSASLYQSYILIEGDAATPSTLEAIASIQDRVRDDTHVVRVEVGGERVVKLQSPVTVLARALSREPSLAWRFNLTTEGRPLPNCTRADVFSAFDLISTNSSFGPQLRQVVHRGGRGYDAALVRVFNFVRDTAQGRRMYSELREDSGGRGVVTGGVVLTLRTLDAFSESQISSTVVSLAFAGVFLSLVYRDPVLGLLSLLPVSISAVWVLGTMYLLSISLNALTLTVTALTIGLGIDYTIYMTLRFRQEMAARGPAGAVQSTVENVGAAIFLCTLTTWAGFGVLAFSPMPITQQFGLMTSATIAYSFLLGVFVFPLALVARARARRRRGASEEE